MKKFLRVSGVSFLIFGALLFLGGVGTVFFFPTEGIIESHDETKHVRPGYPGIPTKGVSIVPVNKGWTQKRVKYSYSVNGKKYISTNIGIAISYLTLSPFKEMNWEGIEVGGKVEVFYWKYFPRLSVLKQGFDGISVLLSLSFGFVLCYLGSTKN